MDEIKSCMRQIQSDIIHIKDSLIDGLIKQNKYQAEKISILEKELKEVKIKVEVDNQKSRENNIIISGIDKNVGHDELEDKCLEVLNSLDMKLTKSDIQACHNIPSKIKDKPSTSIVKFVNRKDAQ